MHDTEDGQHPEWVDREIDKIFPPKRGHFQFTMPSIDLKDLGFSKPTDKEPING